MKAWKANTDVLVQEGPRCLKGVDEGRRLITLAENSGYSSELSSATAAGITLCALLNDKFEVVLEFGEKAEGYEDLRIMSIVSQALAGLYLNKAEVAYNALNKLQPDDPDETVTGMLGGPSWWSFLQLIRKLPNPNEKIARVHEIIAYGNYDGIGAADTAELKADYLVVSILTKADRNLISQLMADLASPEIAMQIQVDKRFDEIRSLPAFARIQDVNAIAQARLDLNQREIAANPDKLQPYLSLATIERWMKRPDAAIATLDKAISLAKKSPSSFEDYAETLPWLYSEKSRALEAKGLAEEGLAANIEAARLRKPQDNDPSQTINLALHYVRIGRHQEALKTFDLVSDGLTDYGKALVVSGRGCASYRLGANEAEVAKVRSSLAEIGKNGERNLLVFEACIGNLEGMEAAYLALLQNPDTRAEALLHAQALRQPSGEIGAEAAKWDVLYREILTRPKVAAALAELGHPLDVPFDTRDFTF